MDTYVNEYKSKDKTLDFITSIIDEGVSNIRQYSDYQFSGYIFSNKGKWYKLIWKYYYGVYIELYQGDSSEYLPKYLCGCSKLLSGSPLLKKSNNIHNKIKGLYSLQRAYKTNIGLSIMNFIDIFERCNSIERLDDSIFLLELKDVDIVDDNNPIKKEVLRHLCFKKVKKTFQYMYTKSHLSISKYDLDGSSYILYETSDAGLINSVFGILNAMYYLNQTADNLGLRKIVDAILSDTEKEEELF